MRSSAVIRALAVGSTGTPSASALTSLSLRLRPIFGPSLGQVSNSIRAECLRLSGRTFSFWLRSTFQLLLSGLAGSAIGNPDGAGGCAARFLCLLGRSLVRERYAMLFKMSSKLRRRLNAAKDDRARVLSELEVDISASATGTRPSSYEDPSPQYEVFVQYLVRYRYQQNTDTGTGTKGTTGTTSTSSQCPHNPEDSIEKDGQYVCTKCGHCGGTVYDYNDLRSPSSGNSPGRKHFYRPEAYLKTYLTRFGSKLPPWAHQRLHTVWPFVIKTFHRVMKDLDPADRPKRKNMVSYPYAIEQLLGRWGLDAAGLGLRRLKTVGRRKDVVAIWAMMAARFPDHL